MTLRPAFTAILALTALTLAWATPALARSGEITVTGVVSDVDPPLRRATITPASGQPIKVQFVWNVGGVCAICLGGGLKGPTFDQTITPGSTWTVVYTPSYPDGAINTVNRVIKPGEADPGNTRGVPRNPNRERPDTGE